VLVLCLLIAGAWPAAVDGLSAWHIFCILRYVAPEFSNIARRTPNSVANYAEIFPRRLTRLFGDDFFRARSAAPASTAISCITGSRRFHTPA